MGEIKQDQGYSWVILISSFVYNMVEAGIFMCPAVYMIDWLEMYGATKAQVGFVSSIMYGLVFVTGLFVGPLVDRYGCRFVSYIGITLAVIGFISSAFAPSIEWLYFTFGAVLGIGEGLLAVPPILMVQYYFDKKRPFACGISHMGHSVGVFSQLPLFRFLIQQYGIRGALLLHSGITMQCFVMASLFRPVDVNAIDKKLQEKNQVSVENELSAKEKKELAAEQDKQKEKKPLYSQVISWFNSIWDFSLFKNMPYVLFVLALVIGEYGIAVMYRFTSVKAVADNVTTMQAALLTSLTGFCSTISRLINSVISNLKCVNRTVLCGIAALCQGIIIMCSCMAWNFQTYAFFMGIYGIFIGMEFTVATTVMTDIIGVSRLAQGSSFSSFFIGIPVFTSLPIAGWIIDTTGNYDISYYIFGSMGCVSGLLILSVPIIQRWQESKVPKAHKEHYHEDELKDPRLSAIFVSMDSIHSF